MERSGAYFLHEQDPGLHKSQEVTTVTNYLRTHGEAIPNEPDAKISAYLGFLAHTKCVHDGILTPNIPSAYAQAEAKITSADAVPQSYFNHQIRIAREQGHGNIELTHDMREAMIETIQHDQREVLRDWATYLAESNYELWFKYLAWETITKLSREQDGDTFKRRSRGTALPHPQLNREALAFTYDALCYRAGTAANPPSDEKLAELAATGNFGKIYKYSLQKIAGISPETAKETKGVWRVYRRSRNPERAQLLAQSLEGYGTGWCTASPTTASEQLQSGDFYVYYTLNDNGDNVVPRIAIRMEGSHVGEVRGILPGQAIEPAMEPIAIALLEQLPGSRSWLQKSKDMRRLTDIEKRVVAENHTPLSTGEVHFLYELTRKIEGFGYLADPRIISTRKLRGSCDIPELIKLTPEVLKAQLRDAYVPYRQALDRLYGIDPGRPPAGTIVSPENFKQLFNEQLALWQRNGTLEFIVNQFIAHDVRFDLVATPNINLSTEHITDYLLSFRKEQETWLAERLLSPVQWSGYKPAQALVRFSLIPQSPYPPFSQKRTAKKQLRELALHREAHPTLNLYAPSILESLVYLQRQQGVSFWTHEALRFWHFSQLATDPKDNKTYTFCTASTYRAPDVYETGEEFKATAIVAIS